MRKLFYFFSPLIALFLFMGFPSWAALRCPVCGMEIAESNPTSFQFLEKEQKIQVCSFVCASRFHRKHPSSQIKVKAHETSEWIEGTKAFYLVKSKNILKEITTQMLPPVIGFKSEQAALECKKRLGDGEVVPGIDAAIRVYE